MDKRKISGGWSIVQRHTILSNWNDEQLEQITCRQQRQKTCEHQFLGQHQVQILVFWVFLVLFRSRIMCAEGIYLDINFEAFEAKCLNFEGCKIEYLVAQIGLYLRKYKYCVKEVNWWNVVHWFGCFSGSIQFFFCLFFKILPGFLVGSKFGWDFSKGLGWLCVLQVLMCDVQIIWVYLGAFYNTTVTIRHTILWWLWHVATGT